MAMNCKNCNTEILQNYCPNCGQALSLKRIDSHYIIHEIEHVLHFEKGILYTIRELTLHPGQNVKHFITENRSRLVKPIIFIIVSSLIYSITNHFFHIEEGLVQHTDTKPSTTALIFKWVQDHYGYANIIMGLFIAGWIKLFFRKYPFNFFEILILLCFVMGMGMLIYTVFALVQGLTHFKLMQVAGIAGIAYSVWAIAQFFDKRRILNYFTALASYILGMLSFSFAVIGAGSLIDLLIKH